MASPLSKQGGKAAVENVKSLPNLDNSAVRTTPLHFSNNLYSVSCVDNDLSEVLCSRAVFIGNVLDLCVRFIAAKRERETNRTISSACPILSGGEFEYPMPPTGR